MPITWLIVTWSAKFENKTSPEKHKCLFFMNGYGTFRTFGQIPVMNFGIQDGIHACLACITCRRLENIATNFLQFHFMNPDNFNFFPGALKNVLSRRFGMFWARVGRVTGTKQLFCQGFKCFMYLFAYQLLLMYCIHFVKWYWKLT